MQFKNHLGFTLPNPSIPVVIASFAAGPGIAAGRAGLRRRVRRPVILVAAATVPPRTRRALVGHVGTARLSSARSLDAIAGSSVARRRVRRDVECVTSALVTRDRAGTVGPRNGGASAVGTSVVEEAKVRRLDDIAVGGGALRERARLRRRRRGLDVDQLEHRRRLRLPSRAGEGGYSNDQEKQSRGAPGDGIAGRGRRCGRRAGPLLVIIPRGGAVDAFVVLGHHYLHTYLSKKCEAGGSPRKSNVGT